MVVKVPMVAPTAVGDTEIKITYVGPEKVPLGGEEGRSWVRSARWAVAAFEYIVSSRQPGAGLSLPPSDAVPACSFPCLWWPRLSSAHSAGHQGELMADDRCAGRCVKL